MSGVILFKKIFSLRKKKKEAVYANALRTRFNGKRAL